MAIRVQVTFDAHEFWQLPLQYVEQPPPPGFVTWQEFAAKIGMTEEQWHAYGAGPRLFFQQVPEGNRCEDVTAATALARV